MSLQAKINAQEKYCRETGLPRFAPADGICYRCHKQIYDVIELKNAQSTLITGCSHCHYSYCE